MLARIAARMQRRLQRCGLDPWEADRGQADPLVDESPALAGISSASIQGRIALGPRAGARVWRLGDDPDAPWVLSTMPRHAHSGAGIGALAGLAGGASAQIENPKDAALAVGIGAAAGFVIGSLIGTFKAGETAAQSLQDASVESFQSCMRERGYTVVRERSPR